MAPRAILSILAAALGAGFASASHQPRDVQLVSDVDQFNSLVDAHGGFPHQTFRSSDIVAPIFEVNTWDRNLTDDSTHIFIGSVYGEMKGGPMILDASDLSLVYADQEYENAYFSEPQTIKGKNYLTFWEGYHSRGHANGFCLVMDEEYNVRYNVSAVGLHGALADMHEMHVTHNDTILFTTYNNIKYDTTAVGGEKDSLMQDSGFQEVDPENNELLFDWHASDWFDVNDTFARYDKAYGVGPDSGFDFFHINSVEKSLDGNYLISSRHLSLLSLIDGTDGHPIWILGGRHNQFKDLSNGTATNFGWQHDARFYNNETHITMFDNHGEHTGACEPDDCKTRGLHLEINTDDMTVRTVAEYYHPGHIDSGAMGGMQKLPNGNVMTGWGYSPGFVEFTEQGELAMDIQRGKLGDKNIPDMFAYRVVKGNWTGRPNWPPSVAMDAPHGTAENATLFLSWNGATDVDRWALFAGEDPETLKDYSNFRGTVGKMGFETVVSLGHKPEGRYVASAAVAANGTILGSSLVWDMSTKQPVMLASKIDSIEPPKSHTKTYGVGGAGVAAAAGVLGFAVWWYRRRRRSAEPVRDFEKAEYKMVATDDQ